MKNLILSLIGYNQPKDESPYFARYEIGQTVYHVSGNGPAMTIDSYENGNYLCSWFDLQNQYHQHEFWGQQLTHLAPSDKNAA